EGRVAREGLSTWTRVVTSNVRQRQGAGSREKRRARGRAKLAETTPAERRKLRRFMTPPARSGGAALGQLRGYVRSAGGSTSSGRAAIFCRPPDTRAPRP